jgi:hypothetical protein
VSENLCVRCERPMPDQAYACPACAQRAGGQLFTVVDTAPAARDVAHGMARRGTSGSGSAEPRLPLNLGATQRLDAVQGTLGTWVRHVVETRGIPGPQPRHLDDDVLVLAANWLAGHVEWLRHRREVGEFLDDVAACARIVEGIARGPGEQKFLGPCGALIGWDADGGEVMRETPCEGDVYAHTGAKEGACRTCRARWATANREAWLDGEVRGHAFRAAQIAEAYGVRANTIRVWAARGQLVPHGHDGEERPLFNVGEVLDLAAADAARRATEQAKRARRAAVKAEEASDAA